MKSKGMDYWRLRSDELRSKSNDSYTYRKNMLLLLKEQIPFDAYCCTLVDPVTLCSIGAVTEHSIEAIHHQILKIEYDETDVYSFESLLKDGVYIGRLSDSLGIQRSRRYEEVLKPNHFSDEIRCVLVFQGRCYGFLTLFKKQQATNPFFSNEDIDRLKIIGPIMAEALQAYYLSIIEVQTFEGELEQGVIILDTQLNIISLNSKASKTLDSLRKMEDIAAPYLPKPLQVMCTRLLARHQPSAPLLIPVHEQGYIVAQVSILRSTQENNFQIAVSLNNATPKDMLSYLMKAYHLTLREQEVVLEIIKGSSTKELAQHLMISYHTAQDHLKAVFQKVQVSNRNELVWKLFSKYQMEP
ncbi:helix-turn-helix transcriptional regulator [Paenibacillus sp. GXUN7292]|uniref:helix-turn-helix transcriptional regulator n=1 Tax=Paenibacillus sp. GXUN7292 TaxID=3422499 RepID=UPI003D7DD12F